MVQTALYGICFLILLGMHNNSTCGLHEHEMRKWTKSQKDTKQSSKTQTAASTSHGRLGFNWLQSKLRTKILHTPTDWQPKKTLLGIITSIHENYWYVILFLSNQLYSPELYRKSALSSFGYWITNLLSTKKKLIHNQLVVFMRVYAETNKLIKHFNYHNWI